MSPFIIWLAIGLGGIAALRGAGRRRSLIVLGVCLLVAAEVGAVVSGGGGRAVPLTAALCLAGWTLAAAGGTPTGKS